MISLARLRPQYSKKRLIILLSIVLFIVALGSYALWSKQAWDAYQPAYQQQHQNLKSDITKLAKAPAATPEDRTAILSGLERAAKQTDVSSRELCDIHPALAWQLKVWRNLAAAQADCSTTLATMAQLGTPLQKVTGYIADDNRLAAILATAPQSTELADSAWEAQGTSWQKVVTDIDGMQTSAAFAPVKAVALTQTTAVKSAWQAVVSAHQAKDKTKYLAAQDTLAGALDGLNEITITSEKELVPLTAALEKAVSSVLAS